MCIYTSIAVSGKIVLITLLFQQFSLSSQVPFCKTKNGITHLHFSAVRYEKSKRRALFATQTGRSTISSSQSQPLENIVNKKLSATVTDTDRDTTSHSHHMSQSLNQSHLTAYMMFMTCHTYKNHTHCLGYGHRDTRNPYTGHSNFEGVLEL